MRRLKTLLILLLFPAFVNAQQDSWTTTFEASDGFKSATYDEMIAYSKKLAEASPLISYEIMGYSAGGLEIPILIVNKTVSN